MGFRISHLGKQQNISLSVFPDAIINEARKKALQAINEFKRGAIISEKQNILSLFNK